MSLGRAALALAANGWEVLPLSGKVPLTRHGGRDATSCLEQIERWWRRWPAANVGGLVPPSAIVLDVDPRNGGDRGWDELVQGRPVPETLTTISGRGDGGVHLYFRRPAGELSRHDLPAGIDLKTNGYCVLPPSVHPCIGGAYEWRCAAIAPLPTWLRDALRPQAVSRPVRKISISTGSMHRLTDFVASQAPGNRNSALYWASRRLLDLGLLDEMSEALVDAAVRSGETEPAARRTVGSARRARAT